MGRRSPVSAQIPHRRRGWAREGGAGTEERGGSRGREEGHAEELAGKGVAGRQSRIAGRQLPGREKTGNENEER